MDSDGGAACLFVGLICQPALFSQLASTTYGGGVVSPVEGCVWKVQSALGAAGERGIAFLADADSIGRVPSHEVKAEGWAAGKRAGAVRDWAGYLGFGWEVDIVCGRWRGWWYG